MTGADTSLATQPDQSAVYRRYLQLQSIGSRQLPDASSDGLAGLLLACIGFAREGAELALATTISGGAFLGIDPSAEHLKAAVRNGACDFMVNTLDESLRVLKNELRKKKALSVGLLGDASAILPAMVERGVQPDLIAETNPSNDASARSDQPSMATFIERGAIHIDASSADQSTVSDVLPVIWTAANLAALRRMDELALQQIPEDDSIRRRWLQQAPAYFHRQRPLQRVLAMRSDERMQFTDAIRNAISAGEMPSPITLDWQNVDGSQQSISH